MTNENYARLKEYFLENEEIFKDTAEELHKETGILHDDVCYPMWELDDFCYGMSATELIDQLYEFDSNDSYFKWTYHGLESCNERDYLSYLDMHFAEQLLLYRGHLCLNEELEALLDEIEEEENSDEL